VLLAGTVGLLALKVSPLAAQVGPSGSFSGGTGVPLPGGGVAAEPGMPFREISPLDENILKVQVEGNVTIPEYVILRQVESVAGRPVSPTQVRDDVRKLYNTRWFHSVEPIFRRSAEGLTLVFRVMEKPVVGRVVFQGNRKIKTTRLEAETGLKPGAPFDVTINREAAQRIRQLYLDKGYRHVQVDLQSGAQPGDRDVIFVINEGPKVQVRRVTIEENQFVRDAVLKLNKETKPRLFGFFGGKYDPESAPNDEAALEQYYQGLGFFDVDVSSETRWVNQEKSLVDVIFHVKEGPRFKVRNVEIVGNEVIPEQRLREGLKLVSGEYFNARHLSTDVQGLKSQYDELGRLFAAVEPQPVFLAEPGWVDLRYAIDEDQPYYVGAINVQIRGDYPHTQEDVVRNQVNAFVKPGSLAKGSDIRRMQARLNGSHLWERTDPPAVNIRRVDGHEYLAPGPVERGQSRAQVPLSAPRPDRPLASAAHAPARQSTASRTAPAGSDSDAVHTLRPISFGHSTDRTMRGHSSAFEKQPTLDDAPDHDSRRSVAVPMTGEGHAIQPAPPIDLWPLSPPELVIRGQDEDDIFRGQSIDQFGNPVPQDYLQGVSPQGDPFGNALRGPAAPGFIDIDIDVTEARTGRLMFGVGVNSDAGVVGSIVLEENNFDITRPPRSFADIVNGQAWRGGGQSFRIEAVPGSEVSRYLVSWQDPFFLNTDYSLGVSGFYYTRFFQNWTEERLGGRLSVGRLLGNFWSVSTAVRLENVQVRDLDTPTPPDLEAVRGDNFLSTVRVALAHDTRDSSFLPTTGHLLELSYEQGIADFTYPRVELTGNQFFTLWERPDGRGKHLLQLRGQLGWTGDDTPIFERFYAGGFQSFRGFEFRGVTPRSATGITLGGQWMALGTAEYLVPITADDNVRGVLFTDVGTVEPDVSLDNVRVSVGAGLRLIIPAMGPAPIALDFAYPLVKEDFDRKQIFSFYVGFTR
jgi:outer membrane protein insertion porin family